MPKKTISKLTPKLEREYESILIDLDRAKKQMVRLEKKIAERKGLSIGIFSIIMTKDELIRDIDNLGQRMTAFEAEYEKTK